MAWSSGTYTKGNSATGGWAGDAASGVGIEAGRHDTQDNDFASGINNCLTKDGQNTPTANLPMGGFKHTNVGSASSGSDYPRYDQTIARNGTYAATADLPMGGFKHTNVGQATSGSEYARADQVVLRNGVYAATANLPMGGFKHTGVANASASNEYMAFGQISNGTTTVNVGDLTATKFNSATATNVKSDWYMLGASTEPNVHRHYKTRGATTTSYDAVTDGDQIGRQDFIVSNGSAFVTAARFGAVARGLVGSNYPAYFIWSTVGSTGSIANRMYLREDGELTLGTGTPFADALITTQKSSGTNRIIAISDSLANTESTALIARGTVSGITRDNSLIVYKHSGITNACAAFEMQRQSGTRDFMWNDDSGNFRTSTVATNIGTTGGTVVGTQTSDERLKNVFGDIHYGLSTVEQLEPVEFAYKDRPDVRCLGFLAQQVKPIVPESVYDTNEPIEGYDSEDTKLAMDYASLVPVLVNAIKELNAKVQTLEARIEALENA